ncbi:MAG TPA: SDR family oxidoreductase [Lacibacter sp.]|nr:SDR family oxidoreductase [Lacibacter sp.]HMO89113.1 SDR family oxidoreductase [Lacibacter sp.]HMP87998.1 SDR family oxidoreductase [Lacibacter sp.]
MDHFKNKVVLVTGGSDGIGRALVELLLNSGANVVTCGRNRDKFRSLENNYIGKPLHITAADVSKEEDCRRFVEEAVAVFGTVDMLVNNAGISMRALVEDTNMDTLRKVMDINFWGTVYCTKYALPHILRKKGIIMGVSSIAGYRGLPGRSGYSASKFAVQGWLESLRTELLQSGVHVMWVCPGFTTSNIRNVALNNQAQPHGETPMDEGAMMPAATCALHILEAAARRKRTLVLTFTGKRTVFLNKFFPGWADKMAYRFFFKDGKLVK